MGVNKPPNLYTAQNGRDALKQGTSEIKPISIDSGFYELSDGTGLMAMASVQNEISEIKACRGSSNLERHVETGVDESHARKSAEVAFDRCSSFHTLCKVSVLPHVRVMHNERSMFWAPVQRIWPCYCIGSSRSDTLEVLRKSDKSQSACASIFHTFPDFQPDTTTFRFSLGPSQVGMYGRIAKHWKAYQTPPMSYYTLESTYYPRKLFAATLHAVRGDHW